MKFGMLLRNSAAETPELQSLFVCYKHLKKRLKRLPERHAADKDNNPEDVSDEVAQRQRNFVLTLIEDVQQFNELFMEKEEDSVIHLRTLEDAAKEAHDVEAVSRVFKEFVDFHGQMLLLVHWSILAYTGLVKILKKHHKRTGLLVRAPHLDNLLSQPFCSVEVGPAFLSLATPQVDPFRRDVCVVAREQGVCANKWRRPSKIPLHLPFVRDVQSRSGTPFSDLDRISRAIHDVSTRLIG